MQQASAQDLQKVGLKATLPRLKILRILEANEQSHMSAEDLYRRLLEDQEEVALATIYRVLTQFEEAGLVERHHFEGGQSVFELKRGEHHDHLICVRCGRVDEFYDESIEHRQRKIADEHGFELTEHTMTLYGLCGDCRLLK